MYKEKNPKFIEKARGLPIENPSQEFIKALMFDKNESY